MKVNILFAIMFSVACVGTFAAGKKNKGAAAKVKGTPFIDITLSSKFERYLKQRKSLDKEFAKVREEDDEKKRQNEEKKLKEEEKSLLEDVSDRISREVKKYSREIKSLEKKLDDLDKQLDKAGDNEKQYDKIMKEVEACQQKLSALNRVATAYAMFRLACSSNQKGMDSYAFGLKNSIAPPIKGSTMEKEPKPFSLDEVKADYKIVIFYSVKNRESLAGLREALGLSGKKTASKETAVVAVNVDLDEDDVAEAQDLMAKNLTRCSPIHDKDRYISGAYKVGFLPQVVLLDSSDSVIEVIVGGGVRKGIQTAIKDHHKENRKR